MYALYNAAIAFDKFTKKISNIVWNIFVCADADKNSMDTLITTKFCALFCSHKTVDWKSLTFHHRIFKIVLGFFVPSLITYFAFGSISFGFNSNRANLFDVTIIPYWHTMRDMVVCIDKLSSDNNSTSKGSKPVHFVFIGDSRIRQHFLNFFKV